ncbi:MAG: FHA domain-containing protein [Deltaproteobacteria bacterium]|nr:FHA domain-containing protein [Deltaproteobacteria bacterium]
MFKLVICDDEGKTTIVPVIRDEITIGRKEGNTIRLTDRNVSRRHARLVREEADFRVEDLGSLCGTKINGEVVKSGSKLVSTGDQIAIGDYNLSIRTDVSASVPLGRQMEAGQEAGIGKVVPHARLVVLTDPTPGREIDLTSNLYVIGRSDEANCQINDPSISRAHARMDGDDGKWTISDLDSINGIQINGQKKDDYVLKAGDVIELGTVRFRFVAPGEPYEFKPEDQHAAVHAKPVARRARSRMPLVLAAAGILVAGAAVAVFLALRGSSGGGAGDTSAASDIEEMSDEELIEAGKDKMQAEDWAGAARLFAAALHRNPNHKVARELKQMALGEVDAQAAFNAGLAAMEAKDWNKAVATLSSVPRSSRYYDLDQLRKASGALCDDFLQMARSAALSEDPLAAERLLDEIRGIPETPETCHAEEAKLRQSLRRKGPGGAQGFAPGAVPPATRGSGAGAGAVPQNPYDEPPQAGGAKRGAKHQIMDAEQPPISAPSDATAWDPVTEARAAMQRGDSAGAIAILEKGGNSRNALVLLTKLYQDTGNRAGYERVAAKFIKLYPDDPKSEQFKKVLGQN